MHYQTHRGLPPQIDDAKNFLEKVKEAFRDTQGVYDRFVEIMKNFKHDRYSNECIFSLSHTPTINKSIRLNTGGVIKEVQTLFSGHDDLFIGFQNFLPAVVKYLCKYAQQTQAHTHSLRKGLSDRESNSRMESSEQHKSEHSQYRATTHQWSNQWSHH